MSDMIAIIGLVAFGIMILCVALVISSSRDD